MKPNHLSTIPGQHKRAARPLCFFEYGIELPLSKTHTENPDAPNSKGVLSDSLVGLIYIYIFFKFVVGNDT